MADDVERNVITRFSLAGAALQGVSQLGGKFAGLGKKIMAVQAMMGPLTGALGALGGGLTIKAITDLGDQFEQTQITMAGFLSSLGISKNYAQGFQLAESVMGRIRVAAAALPGEAQEYVEVFKAGLPVVSKAVGGTIQQMTAFTNRYTAIAKTLQVDSAQAARDLTLMLRAGAGGAGMDVRTFMQLLPFMKQVEGQANLTRETFNKMTSPERAKLMMATFEKLDPMLAKSANSFDAMWGAIKSNTAELMRLATVPLFEAAKRMLERVNSLIYDTNGQLTPMGKSIVDIGKAISNEISAALEVGVRVATNLWDTFKGLAASPAFKQLQSVLTRILETVEQIGEGLTKLGGFTGIDLAVPAPEAAGMAPTEAPGPAAAAAPAPVEPPSLLAGLDIGIFEVLIGAAGIAAAAFTGLGLPALLLSGGLIGLMSNTEALSAIWESVSSILDTLLQVVSPVIDLFMGLSGIIGDLLGAVLPPLLGGLDLMLQALLPLWNALMEIVNTIVGMVQPVFAELFGAVGSVVEIIGGVLAVAFYGLSAIVLAVIEALRPAAPAFSIFVEQLKAAAAQIGAFLKWLAEIIGEAAKAIGSAAGEETTSGIKDITRKLERGAETGMGAGAPTAGGGARGGGGRATNDFRFSRFEITQKFEEGFDPDRIAVAFVQDIGRLGEQRAQSGYEPLFSLR